METYLKEGGKMMVILGDTNRQNYRILHRS